MAASMEGTPLNQLQTTGSLSTFGEGALSLVGNTQSSGLKCDSSEKPTKPSPSAYSFKAYLQRRKLAALEAPPAERMGTSSAFLSDKNKDFEIVTRRFKAIALNDDQGQPTGHTQ